MKKNALFTLVPLLVLGFGLAFATTATPGHGIYTFQRQHFSRSIIPINM